MGLDIDFEIEVTKEKKDSEYMQLSIKSLVLDLGFFQNEGEEILKYFNIPKNTYSKTFRLSSEDMKDFFNWLILNQEKLSDLTYARGINIYKKFAETKQNYSNQDFWCVRVRISR